MPYIYMHTSHTSYLSFCRTHDVLRVEGQQRLVVLVLGLVVRGSSQQLPKLLAVSIDAVARQVHSTR